MYAIRVKPFLDNYSFPEAGNALYEEIVDQINNEDNIILNVEGIDMLPSMFLNMSIGRIIENYGLDTLKSKISFAKINTTQAQRIADYIKRFSKQ